MKNEPDSVAGSDSPSFDEACRFIIKLGEAAHGYGSTTTRLEAFLSRLTKSFGYNGVFRSMPTEIIFAFQEGDDPWQRTHMVAMPGTGIDLTRLAAVGDLVDDVESGNISLSDASVRLDEIDTMPHPWGTIASAASYAMIGAAFAVLLSGSWWDVLVSALLSLVVYGMVSLSGRFGVFTAEWLPLSTAFVAGLLAAATQVFVPDLNIVLVTLSAILVLIPGYSISVGVVELVANHVVSGTSNLMSGLVYLVKQFVGAWLGVRLAGLLWSTSPLAGTGTGVDAHWLWLFMPLLIIGLGVVFQTSRRDFLWVSLGSAIAYGGILLGSAMVGANLGNLLGTIIAVVYANTWSARTKRPTSIILVPSIILLVSGSIGFRGLAAMSLGQVASGEQQFLQMFIVALTIAAGLLIGNTVVRPEKTL